GSLVDKATGLPTAAAHIAAAELTERCTVVGGNFLEAVPSGGDLYLLSWILAGHDDAEAQTILRHCHAAMHAEGKGRRQTGVGRKRNRPPATPPPTQPPATLPLPAYTTPPH